MGVIIPFSSPHILLLVTPSINLNVIITKHKFHHQHLFTIIVNRKRPHRWSLLITHQEIRILLVTDEGQGVIFVLTSNT